MDLPPSSLFPDAMRSLRRGVLSDIVSSLESCSQPPQESVGMEAPMRSSGLLHVCHHRRKHAEIVWNTPRASVQPFPQRVQECPWNCMRCTQCAPTLLELGIVAGSSNVLSPIRGFRDINPPPNTTTCSCINPPPVQEHAVKIRTRTHVLII